MIARILNVDKFIAGLFLAVIIASVLPATGKAALWFSSLTDFAIVLLFFLHGAKLSRSTVVAGLIHWRLHLCVLSATFIIFPILGLSLKPLAPGFLSTEIYTAILFLCLLPSTVQSSIAFTSIAGGNVSAAVCAATASNILGIFLTPLLTGLLLSGTGDISISFDSIKSIMLQLLLPFIIGQIVQPKISPLLAKYKKIVGVVDRSSILLVVYSAFSAAVVSGLWQKTSLKDIAIITIISCLLLAAILFITVYGSRLLGFNLKDEITITFCGSKKSLASGVPIASVIFAGHDIGIILLPLMIFHQIQLIVCAFIARHYAKKTNTEGDDGGY